jgi:hypothetical protein
LLLVVRHGLSPFACPLTTAADWRPAVSDDVNHSDEYRR